MENKETYALLSNIFVKIKNTKMDKKLSTTAETLLLNPHPTESFARLPNSQQNKKCFASGSRKIDSHTYRRYLRNPPWSF